MPTTTKAHFELFKTECQKWQKFFGLLSWRIMYLHEEPRSKAMASCATSLSQRVATIRLNPKWPREELNDKIIKETAFHEICELLLTRLDHYMTARFVIDDSDFEEALHEVIRTLENVIFNARRYKKRNQNGLD